MSELRKIEGPRRRYCIAVTRCTNRADWVEITQVGREVKEMAYCDEHKPQLKIKPVPVDDFGNEK